MSRSLHARWILPIVVLVGAFVLVQGARSPRWRVIAPGIEFQLVRGEPYVRQGSSAIAVLRIDPRHARLRVRHFSRMPSTVPPGIAEWQRETRALAVFNAGQYYPDWSYMGLLRASGRAISARAHPQFRAALVAHDDSVPAARVLDLEGLSVDSAVAGWSEVAQSFMLFDEQQGVRVRRSGRIAARTAVGEDITGRIVVLVSEGGYTLADFATLLRKSPLRIRHAMSMDGGLEAEMVVHADDFRYASYGHVDRPGPPGAAGARAPLPAVITVEPR